jgi:prevent-host-death family protein
MAAGEFKAKCLAVMAEVNATGLPVLVTKRGKPLARILPHEESRAQEAPDAIFGCLPHFLVSPEQLGDLTEPIVPLEAWEHLKEDWSPFPPE